MQNTEISFSFLRTDYCVAGLCTINDGHGLWQYVHLHLQILRISDFCPAPPDGSYSQYISISYVNGSSTVYYSASEACTVSNGVQICAGYDGPSSFTSTGTVVAPTGLGTLTGPTATIIGGDGGTLTVPVAPTDTQPPAGGSPSSPAQSSPSSDLTPSPTPTSNDGVSNISPSIYVLLPLSILGLTPFIYI